MAIERLASHKKDSKNVSYRQEANPAARGVKYTVSEGGKTVLVEGPKGKVSAMLPGGITWCRRTAR
jgi:hypothetical protein